jgi:signal transduction histidine kinase
LKRLIERNQTDSEVSDFDRRQESSDSNFFSGFTPDKPMADFFANHIVAVYFFYGLSFFSMGIAVMLELGHSSELDFAQALRPLAGFGLVHGSHEWMEMFILISGRHPTDPGLGFIGPLRVCLLAASFMMLLGFGARLIAGPTQPKLKWAMMVIVTLICAVGLIWIAYTRPLSAGRLVAMDVYTRYSLAIPGAALTTWGLILQRRRFYQAGMKAFGHDVSLAAVAFGLYGGIGQLFASSSAIFPSIYLNADAFVRWFGFPIQVFRAVMACFAAVFIIRSLRAFEEESHRQVENLRQAQVVEHQRLEKLRADLLHQTVKAQESERQRIARELHDEIGQTLTALGMGLRGLSETTATNPQRAAQQAVQLEKLVSTGLEELQNLVTGLHPPQLDDLGLLAGLRWLVSKYNNQDGLQIQVTCQGHEPELPSEVRAVLYHITQEALTNVVRHANASKANIQLLYTDVQINMQIEDDGQGFDVETTLNNRLNNPCWGLLGMMERAELVGGTCQISSQLGKGTSIVVQIKVI